jgi:hypothetical protein
MIYFRTMRTIVYPLSFMLELGKKMYITVMKNNFRLCKTDCIDKKRLLHKFVYMPLI